MKPPFPEFTPKDEDPAIVDKTGGVEPPALFEEDEQQGEDTQSISRLRDVPFRMLVPNLITLGAICSGLTGIRMAFEGRFELAVVAIVFASILDALDGRVARFLKSSTSFGEQLDSLADFVNFGVTPAIIVYMWGLQDLRAFGWAVALVFAICGCLRLARFNVMLEAPDKPDWHVDFFTGVPAPAGALLCLLPVYLGLLGVEPDGWISAAVVIYVLLIGFLMASNIPTWSGKRAGARVSRRWVIPVMLSLILAVVLLFSYPWTVLTVGCLVYLSTVPFSIKDYARREGATV
ncbi:MAG: CDP-diacylglycerol--serine O-phosphatidyltransferase [Pseudomonadota bacterium]